MNKEKLRQSFTQNIFIYLEEPKAKIDELFPDHDCISVEKLLSKVS